MSLIGKPGGGDFTPHPKGVFPAIVVDVIDRGLVENKMFNKVQHKFSLRLFGGKYKVDDEGELVTDDKGNKVPLFVDQWLTLSSHKRSKARQLVEQGLGRKFTAKEEREGFDYESLLGKQMVMLVVHNETDRGIYANLSALMPLQEGQTAPGVPDGHVREIDKPPEKSYDARIAVEAEEGDGRDDYDNGDYEENPGFDNDARRMAEEAGFSF